MIPIDEMVDGQGGVRPQWRHLLSVISELGHQELTGRRLQIALALSDQTGVLVPARLTGQGFPSSDMRVSADALGMVCDPIPLILRGHEFATLEAGVVQRARVLEALVTDVYGERSVLKERLLPPSLVWANRGFLRGGHPDGGEKTGRFISSYAVDLVREADGRWRVLGDRVERGNGIGLAIESRRQMARAVPEFFGGMEVRRLGSFLDRWQDSIQHAGFSNEANPSVALLTSGPSSPHWGEHVILARELACALVEAGDLTVREGELWLKTVRGLRRVDVLLMRQDTTSIDPLELDSDGPGGVSGLLDAARNGSVRLMNDPRAGFVEAVGTASFLPGLCRHFLGEELLLDNIETVWLGASGATAFVEQLLFPSGGNDSLQSGRWAITSALGDNRTVHRLSVLDYSSRARLSEEINRNPWRYSAYREPLASVSPTVGNKGIVPRTVVLRLFAIHDNDGWSVLPGGIARVFGAEEPVTVEPIRAAQTIKDVWVTIDEHVSPREAPLTAHHRLAIRRAQGDLPSRAADDFFWLGRYLEQIERGARLLRVALGHISGSDPSPRERADFDVLSRQMQEIGILQQPLVPGYGLSSIVRGLSTAASADGYFARTLRKITRLVPELADRLTQDVRDYITHRANSLLDRLGQRAHPTDLGRALEQLVSISTELLVYNATLSGFAAESMVSSGGRQFLDLGRRIERASGVLLNCASILNQPDVHQRGRMEGALRLMLEVGDSVITYRSRYFSVVQPAPVLDLLLLDEDNPRGAGFQLAALRDSLSELAVESQTVPEAQRAMSLELAELAEGIRETLAGLVDEVFYASSQDAAAALLPPKLKEVQAAVTDLSDRIGRSYFSVLNSPRLVGIGNETALDESVLTP